MTDDFNICNSDWDLSYPHHSIHADTLHKISDSLSLELSIPINPIPIWYTDNAQDLNSVIDLMFLRPNHRGFDNHQIIPDLQRPSDHAPLTVSIATEEEYIHMMKQTITKNSKEEKEFIKELGEKISSTDTSNIPDSNSLESIIQKLAIAIEDLWNKYSKYVNITKCSKK